jgi:glycerol-3-phosphate dehydrogenase (NAD(P)+)
MKIAILGAGAWGSALAIALAERHDVALWTRHREDCERLSRERVSRYLPQVPITSSVRIEGDLAAALRDAQVALVATATAGLRDTAAAVARAAPATPIVWACKGFEEHSGELPHRIVAAAAPSAPAIAALSGPSFALEVARGQPTALVIASQDGQFASRSAAALNSSRLRIYSSSDVMGVELGGALKNVIAIAAGISDGLELGRNARAALITRGLAEMSRLGVAMGGHAETFMGLAGVGDLVLTCTGELSRNRDVGMRLAKGRTLSQALTEVGHVAEGVNSARAALAHAREHAIEMPITEAVCAVLFESRPALQAVQQLLTRDPRRE